MTVDVYPDDIVEKDPNEKRVVTFDWDRNNLEAGVEIATSVFVVKRLEPKPGQDRNTLTLDFPSVIDSNRSTQVRMNAGTLGGKYQLTNRIETNESPSQTKEFSIFVRIVDK